LSWWHTPIITALGRLRQADCKFMIDLGYILQPGLRKKKEEEEKTKIILSS
jgi:hypothetical protein